MAKHNTENLRLEVEVPTTGLRNLVPNPSGEGGAWGWVTTRENALLTAGVADDKPYLRGKYVSTTGGVYGYYQSDMSAITAGHYVAARLDFINRNNSDVRIRVRYRFFDNAKEHLSYGTITSDLDLGTHYVTPAQVPSGAEYVALEIVSGRVGPVAAVVNDYVDFRNVMLTTAETNAFSTTRTNLVPNPTMLNDTWGWNVSQGTMFHSTSVGGGSVRGTKGSSGQYLYIHTDPITISGGKDYVFGAAVRSAGATGAPVGLQVQWLNGTTSLGWTNLTMDFNTTNEWRRMSRHYVAPASANKVVMRVAVKEPTQGKQYYVNAAMIEQTTVEGDYFDGDFASGGTIFYSWTGTAHRSPSIESNTSFAFAAPRQWQNILGPTSEIRVSRGSFDAGTMSAQVNDALLDPAFADTIRPGRQIRLMSALENTTGTEEILTEQRRNLIPNPSFEMGTLGWATHPGHTLYRTTSEKYVGTSCMAVTESKPAEHNILANPDLENTIFAKDFKWYYTPNVDADKAASTDKAHKGTKSFKITVNQSFSNNWSVIAFGPEVGHREDFEYGKSYTLIGWVYATAALKARWRITHQTKNGGPYDFSINQNATTLVANEWNRLSISFTVPAGLTDEQSTRYWSTLIQVGGDGTVPAGTEVYFDDFYAYEGTPDNAYVDTLLTLEPNTTYTYSVYTRAKETARNVCLMVDEFDEDWGHQSYKSSDYVKNSTTGWTRHTVTFTTGPNTANVYFNIEIFTQSFSGETHYIDGVLLEKAPSARPYFDGATPDESATSSSPGVQHSWEGTAHNSVSILSRVDLQEVTVPVDPSPIFTGTIMSSTTTYDKPKKPGAKVKTSIALNASDNMQRLANTSAPMGVAKIDDVPALLETTRVPWNVNGSGNQVAGVSYPFINENASVADQIAVARDSALGYAWIDRYGVLQVWDRDQIPNVLEQTFSDVTGLSYSNIEADFSTEECINDVTVNWLRHNIGTGETSEVPYGPYRDAASVEQWGSRSATFTIAGEVESASAIADFASQVLAYNAQPKIKVNTLTMPVKDEDGIYKATNLDLYSLVNVTYDTLVDVNLRITSIEHNITPDKWEVTYGFNTEGAVAAPTFVPSPPSGVIPRAEFPVMMVGMDMIDSTVSMGTSATNLCTVTIPYPINGAVYKVSSFGNLTHGTAGAYDTMRINHGPNVSTGGTNVTTTLITFERNNRRYPCHMTGYFVYSGADGAANYKVVLTGQTNTGSSNSSNGEGGTYLLVERVG